MVDGTVESWGGKCGVGRTFLTASGFIGKEGQVAGDPPTEQGSGKHLERKVRKTLVAGGGGERKEHPSVLP